MTIDKKAGVLITDQGEIINLFSLEKGRGEEMKPESLENKKCDMLYVNEEGKDIIIEAYKEKDVVSAVNWLKEQIINEASNRSVVDLKVHLGIVMGWVDEAFADVTKVKK